jgi:hypothetical protein
MTDATITTLRPSPPKGRCQAEPPSSNGVTGSGRRPLPPPLPLALPQRLKLPSRPRRLRQFPRERGGPST